MATILIVEDRAVDRQFLTTLLGYAGHTVLEAPDGVEALAIMARQRPDLVISDLLMPTIDGFEFVRRVRALPDLAATPVIFYTATYHEREALKLAQECGVADVLTKPSEPQQILAKVEAVLGGKHPPQPRPSTDENFDRLHAAVVGSKLLEKVRDLEANEERLKTVVRIGQELATERNPERLLELVGAAAREVALAQHAIVGLLNDDGTGVRSVVITGPDPAAHRVAPPAGPVTTSVLSPVLADRRTIRKKNPSGRPEDAGFSATQFELFSYLAVPFASPSRVYGWLSVRNKLGADEFTDVDEQVLITLGAQAGVAFENAHLLAELNRRAVSLEEAEARTRFAHESARIGVWRLDLDTRRMMWSDSMALVFAEASEALPQTEEDAYDLIHPDDRRGLRDAIANAVETRTSFTFDVRTKSIDKPARWAQVMGRVSDGGEGPSMLGVAIDITERKSLEAQLQQAQKMEAVGQLAGGVAHDFNNLLTAILGYSQFLLDGLESDARRADAEEILKAGHRAAALTRQLLAFSRKQVLQLSVVDLNALVKDIAKMLHRLIGEHIELSTALAADLPLVRVDIGQIEQVLMNLAVNGRDAMPSGGRLRIETTRTELDASSRLARSTARPGRYVMLAVSDTGTGMDEDVQQHLFEPFFTTKEQGKGTGLGLATVYGIVQQCGGYLSVYSELGLGTTFKVYLPEAAASEAREREGLPPRKSAGGTEHVLLVEDEDAVRLLARTILDRAGYDVTAAANPRDAEALFRDHTIDVLVTDVVMPGGTGIELFRRLSAEKPELRVVYTSGYTDQSIADQVQPGPGAAFLQKPFTAEGLVGKVREVLDR